MLDLSKLNSDSRRAKAIPNYISGPALAGCGLIGVSPLSFLRKEVIQPLVPQRLPCYDFTLIINHTLGACLPKVSPTTSGTINSHGVTGGVYKARERIHRGMLIRDY